MAFIRRNTTTRRCLCPTKTKATTPKSSRLGSPNLRNVSRQVREESNSELKKQRTQFNLTIQNLKKKLSATEKKLRSAERTKENLLQCAHSWDNNVKLGIQHNFDGGDGDGSGSGYSDEALKRQARNVVCRIWAYCRETKDGTTARAGRVNQLLLQVFRRLHQHVPEALEFFSDSWFKAYRLVDTLIVDRVRDALTMLKLLSTYSGEDLKAYHVLLTSAAPPIVADNQRKLGKGKRIGERLLIPTESKWQGGNRKKMASEKARLRRNLIDRIDKGDIRVGDEVIYREHGGNKGTRKADRVDRVAKVKNIKMTVDSQVELTLEIDVVGEKESINPKNVRAPWWGNVDRASGKISEDTVKDIHLFCTTKLPTSPCKKDYRRRWIAHKRYVYHQTHFLYGTKRSLWENFCKDYPHRVVKYATFKKHIPWWVPVPKSNLNFYPPRLNVQIVTSCVRS